eukprot:g80303.t1
MRFNVPPGLAKSFLIPSGKSQDRCKYNMSTTLQRDLSHTSGGTRFAKTQRLEAKSREKATMNMELTYQLSFCLFSGVTGLVTLRDVPQQKSRPRSDACDNAQFRQPYAPSHVKLFEKELTSGSLFTPNSGYGKYWQRIVTREFIRDKQVFERKYWQRVAPREVHRTFLHFKHPLNSALKLNECRSPATAADLGGVNFTQTRQKPNPKCQGKGSKGRKPNSTLKGHKHGSKGRKRL